MGGEEVACCNGLVESVVLALLRWVGFLLGLFNNYSPR